MIKFSPDRIAALQKVKGLNDRAFGAIINKPGHLIDSWKCGKYQPSTQAIQDMCNHFGVDPGYFFVEVNA